jgi:fatty-acyl-CoA synthase
MHGLMMADQLLVTNIMRFAERNFPDTEIVSVIGGHGVHRCSYAEAFRRTRRLANALRALGVQEGDRVGTLAWNDFRHFEIYYATSCSGAVCHTVNPRLFSEQIAYIVDHAQDQWIFADPMFAGLLDALWPTLKSPQGVVFLTDAAHVPQTGIPRVHDYESLIAEQEDSFDWPDLDERSASALCYTSGTTGCPMLARWSAPGWCSRARRWVIPPRSRISSTPNQSRSPWASPPSGSVCWTICVKPTGDRAPSSGW